MTRVKVGEHRWVNISRRSLCDNCVADICFKRDAVPQNRVESCDLFRSPFVAFKKCAGCGSIFEIFSNFNAVDYDRCHSCNYHSNLVDDVISAEAHDQLDLN